MVMNYSCQKQLYREEFVDKLQETRALRANFELLHALAVAYLYPGNQSDKKEWCRLRINHEQGEEHGSTTRVDLLREKKAKFYRHLNKIIFDFHFFFYHISFFKHSRIGGI